MSRISCEAIRLWCLKFGPKYARTLKRRQDRLGDTWHLDELFVTIQGQRQYLWRAVDQGGVPRRMVTDKLRSYAAAHRTIMPSVAHDTTQYANNRAEVSHEPIRQRERGMRRFKSMAQAQRFLSVHGITQNLFRVGRHPLRARAFVAWNAVTCA
jgi:putative transposase